MPDDGRSILQPCSCHLHLGARGAPSSPSASLRTLQRFNRKVGHLEASGFARRFADALPNLSVIMHEMEGVEVERGGLIHITAKMSAVLEEFDQDEIDAFVLTLRLFTQRNDSISLASLGSIYAAAWMPEEARLRFTEQWRQCRSISPVRRP